MIQKDCCLHGVREIKDEIVGNTQALDTLHGLTKKAYRMLVANPNADVRALTSHLTSTHKVTLDDVMGLPEGSVDPIVYYDRTRDGENIPGTELKFVTMALAVATCVTRATSGVCQELYPIELETVTTRGE